MIPGVSFQPGGGHGESPYRDNKTQAGVQEAIKVLSLRLPRVVGAQGIAPQALMSSPGSGGDSRVDSIVGRVWAKLFPTGGDAAAGPAPNVPSFGDGSLITHPSPGESWTMPVSPPVRYGSIRRETPSIDNTPLPRVPRVIPADTERQPNAPVFESLPAILRGQSPYGQDGPSSPVLDWPGFNPPEER